MVGVGTCVGVIVGVGLGVTGVLVGMGKGVSVGCPGGRVCQTVGDGSTVAGGGVQVAGGVREAGDVLDAVGVHDAVGVQEGRSWRVFSIVSAVGIRVGRAT